MKRHMKETMKRMKRQYNNMHIPVEYLCTMFTQEPLDTPDESEADQKKKKKKEKEKEKRRRKMTTLKNSKATICPALASSM